MPYHLHITHDEYSDSPREWDNVTTMACGHRRYRLGDDTGYDTGDYNSWADMREVIEADNDVLIIKPLYLYDHSGITISTTPFSCQWDSGQVGWVYITKESWVAMMGATEPLPALMEDVIDSEVNTYDQYLTGEVYSFSLENGEGESIDTCGGFYGDDPTTNGMIDHVPTEYLHDLTVHPLHNPPYKLTN